METREIRINGTLAGVDDETQIGFFGKDEKCTLSFDKRVTVSAQKPEMAMPMVVMKWGGECRAEFEAKCTYGDQGAVIVAGIIRLYEGTSETTHNLVGAKPFNHRVPRGTNMGGTVKVQSKAPGADDRVTAVYTISNNIVEK